VRCAYRLNFSIALGFWFLDCHATRRTSIGGLLQNEGCVQYGRALMAKNAVWEIPFGVLVPPAGSVTNLLTVCTPSSSHVGFQAFRVEPTYLLHAISLHMYKPDEVWNEIYHTI
jgi:hypothetical protein